MSHDGSMVLLYMVTWIPSIYPIYVSIEKPAPWIRWVWFYVVLCGSMWFYVVLFFGHMALKLYNTYAEELLYLLFFTVL